MSLEKFQKTEFFIEATDAELLYHWERNENLIKLPWVQDCIGWCQEIGTFGGMPLVATFQWFTYNNKLICAYTYCSNVCNWKVLEEWIQGHNPVYKDRHCNSDNFGHLVSFVEENHE